MTSRNERLIRRLARLAFPVRNDFKVMRIPFGMYQWRMAKLQEDKIGVARYINSSLDTDICAYPPPIDYYVFTPKWFGGIGKRTGFRVQVKFDYNDDLNLVVWSQLYYEEKRNIK